MGEGGTDPTIPIAGNKACNFASNEIQDYFGGAYVLAPQAPTFWMEGTSGGFGDGTSKYEKALMALIKLVYIKIKMDHHMNILDISHGYMYTIMTV